MDLLGEIGRGVTDAFAQVNQATTNLTSGTFTVNKDNVLAAAKIIQPQADALEDKLFSAGRQLTVVPPGNDDVSTKIAPAWNDLLVYNENSYANRIKQYVDGLRKLASQCADSARAYGYTEDQITAAFGSQSA
jgi:hypothetical protein